MQGTILAGRYKIVRMLGKGGFGETYIAEDQYRYNSLCVVKKLKPVFNDPPRLQVAKNLFHREAEALHKLGDEHEQIPQLLAHFDENLEFYLVQDFVEGEDLRKIFSAKKTLQENEVIEILKDILQVLQFLHNKSVIHRDIKPENLIKRNKDNKIVLIDFGAVKENLTEGSTIIGTRGYMSPEQLDGKPQFCSDIYALGMVGIEALTGIHPSNFTKNIKNGEVNELTQVNINPILAQILHKMVKSDVEGRYHSASEVIQALKGLNSTPLTNKSKNLSNRKNQFNFGLASALGIILLIPSGIWLYNWLVNDTSLMCILKNVPNQTFTYSGSTTWQNFREDAEKSIQAICPGFKLSFQRHPIGQSASGFAIRKLIDEQIDFAISSRPIKDEEFKEAQSRGFGLEAKPVAIDGIAIAVNHNLPISGLTVAQLRDIFAGKITDWKQVGGPNLPITVYVGKTSNDLDVLKVDILNEQPLRQVEDVSTITEGIKEVASNLGGIYIGTASQLVPQCGIKTLPIGYDSQSFVPPYQEPFISPTKCTTNNKNKPNSSAFITSKYPLTRKLFVIVKKNGGIQQQAGEAYANLLLLPTQQELIEKAGFVRIK